MMEDMIIDILLFFIGLEIGLIGIIVLSHASANIKEVSYHNKGETMTQQTEKAKEKRYNLKSREDGLDNECDLVIGQDGHIHFCEDVEHGQVYLYPKQANQLIKILCRKLQQKHEKEKKAYFIDVIKRREEAKKQHEEEIKRLKKDKLRVYNVDDEIIYKLKKENQELKAKLDKQLRAKLERIAKSMGKDIKDLEEVSG